MNNLWVCTSLSTRRLVLLLASIRTLAGVGSSPTKDGKTASAFNFESHFYGVAENYPQNFFTTPRSSRNLSFPTAECGLSATRRPALFVAFLPFGD
jgi:hypothetical protein